jgi:hypothetical protein
MEHLILQFEHDIRDLIPYSEFVQAVRPDLAQKNLGEYLGDDMAIDGGDAVATFASPDVHSLFDYLVPLMRELPFLREARITFVFGPLESDAKREQFILGALE